MTTRAIVRPIVRPIVRAIVGGLTLSTGLDLLDNVTGALIAGTTFTRASTATYYNAAGTMVSAAINTARYDYQAAFTGGVSGTFRGLLIESQKTNAALRSQEFDNASWTKTNVTATADQAADPFGTSLADTLSATLANGTVQQAVATTAINWTFSVFLRRKTGTGNVDISMDGVTWVTKAVTASLQRFEVTQTGVAGTSNPGIRLVTSGDEVYAFGAQPEAGSFASSYIPTVGATVTRSRDIATIPLATIGYAAAGSSAFAEFVPIRPLLVTVNVLGSGSAGRYIYANGASNVTMFDGTTAVNSGAPPVALTTMKAASSFGGATMSISANGAAAVSGAYDGSWDVTGTLLYIGAIDSTTSLDGWLRRARYYNRKLTGSELTAATA